MRTAPDTPTLSREAQRARELLQVGRPARALAEFRRLARAVEALSESTEILEVRARVLLGLAAAGFEVSGRFDEAVELLDEARRLAAEAGADHLTVPIEGQRGLLLLRRGDFRSALAVFDRAGEGLDAAAPYDRMTLLLNRGSLHLERGRLSAALRDLEECSVLAEEHQVVTLAWKAQHNLGWAEFLAGRIPRAIATLERAEALNPGEPHPVGMLDRARVLREAGLVQEADASLERAGEAQRAAGSWQDLAETEMARAECALLAGRPDDALRLARAARHRLARRSNLTLRRRAEVLVLQCSRAAADDRDGPARRTALTRVAQEASALAVRCRAERRADLGRRAELIAWEAALRAADGPSRSPAASTPPQVSVQVSPTGAPPPVRRHDPLATRLLTREVRALAAAAQGDTRRAVGEVRRGLAELGSYQHSFGSLDLRTASAVHGSALARLGLQLALHHGTPADVLGFIERSRAVSTRLPQVRAPSDPVSAELLAAMRRVEEEIRGLVGDPAAGEVVARLRREASALQRDVRVRAWELEGGAGAVAEAPRATRLGMAAASDGSAFVTFARDRGRWLAVVARRAPDQAGGAGPGPRRARPGHAGAGRPGRPGDADPARRAADRRTPQPGPGARRPRRGRPGAARAAGAATGALLQRRPDAAAVGAAAQPARPAHLGDAERRGLAARARAPSTPTSSGRGDRRTRPAAGRRRGRHGGEALARSAGRARGGGDDRGGLRRPRQRRPGARQCTRSPPLRQPAVLVGAPR